MSGHGIVDDGGNGSGVNVVAMIMAMIVLK